MKILYLRVPDEIYTGITNLARINYRSLNQQCIASLEQSLQMDDNDVYIPVERTPKDTRMLEFCDNNHPIPRGLTKCLGKGCKYS